MPFSAFTICTFPVKDAAILPNAMLLFPLRRDMAAGISYCGGRSANDPSAHLRCFCHKRTRTRVATLLWDAWRHDSRARAYTVLLLGRMFAAGSGGRVLFLPSPLVQRFTVAVLRGWEAACCYTAPRRHAAGFSGTLAVPA